MNGITRSRVGLMGTLVLAAGMTAFALAAPARGALRSTVAHPHNWIGVPYVVCQLLHIGPSTTTYGTLFYCDDEVVQVGTLTITCKPLSNVTPPPPPPGQVAHPNTPPAPCPPGFVPYADPPGTGTLPPLPPPVPPGPQRPVRFVQRPRIEVDNGDTLVGTLVHGRLLAQRARSERQPPRPRGTH